MEGIIFIYLFIYILFFIIFLVSRMGKSEREGWGCCLFFKLHF